MNESGEVFSDKKFAKGKKVIGSEQAKDRDTKRKKASVITVERRVILKIISQKIRESSADRNEKGKIQCSDQILQEQVAPVPLGISCTLYRTNNHIRSTQ